jgi:uncharacterized membrane protein YtjA (UPF0391 family)
MRNLPCGRLAPLPGDRNARARRKFGDAEFFRAFFRRGRRGTGNPEVPSGVFSRTTEAAMFTWAVIFLMISLAAGAMGLVNISEATRRISFILFAVFFFLFAVVMGLTWIIGEAIV